jgi:hypothetical protein
MVQLIPSAIRVVDVGTRRLENTGPSAVHKSVRVNNASLWKSSVKRFGSAMLNAVLSNVTTVLTFDSIVVRCNSNSSEGATRRLTRPYGSEVS